MPNSADCRHFAFDGILFVTQQDKTIHPTHNKKKYIYYKTGRTVR